VRSAIEIHAGIRDAGAMTHPRHRSLRLHAGLLATALIGSLAAASPAAAQALTVMSLNIRMPSQGDGANLWEKRRDLAAAAIARRHPDVIGTQELFQRQGDDLVARLPGYAWFGIDRRGGHADEHMGILYDTRRLKLIEHGEFWLSDTPEVPGSISWDHPLPRNVNWAIFERIGKGPDKGKRFRMLDTHFPYRDEDEAAREKGAALIAARLATLPGRDLPTVLTGDFNTTPDSATWATLRSRFTDARAAAPVRTGPEATFHDFTGVASKRIDGIFLHGFTATRFETVTDHEGKVWVSDHFPVVATLKPE
jgi:endonuclease/exonuclease/phosphatase family metal-dependent hydrolase